MFGGDFVGIGEGGKKRGGLKGREEDVGGMKK